MPQVSNLQIVKMAGSDNTYFATWNFEGASINQTNTTSNIYVGDWVKVKQGAKWYNGAGIPSYVFNDTWKVVQINGDRVVINQNKAGNQNIMSPIAVYNLTKENGSSASTTSSYDTLDHYSIMWAYYTMQGMWFHSTTATTYREQGAYDGSATYQPPTEAIKFRCTVTPVAKTHKVNDQDVAYWMGTPVVKEYDTQGENLYTPDAPSAPTVTIDKNLTLTAQVAFGDFQDSRSEWIEFEVYNGLKLYRTGRVEVKNALATFTCTVAAGGNYRVRCRAWSWGWNGIAQFSSEWSGYSGEVKSLPSAPAGIEVIRALSGTSVLLQWTKVDSADTYDIEYATNSEWLSGNGTSSNAATVKTGIETNNYSISGLESGHEYWFQVRAVNSQGHSDYCTPRGVVLGMKPSAPTTWSSSTTVIVGDPLILYWVHNAEDNSWESYAQLEIWINGVKETHTVESEQTPPEDITESGSNKTEKTHSYTIDTSTYAEGAKIEWRVRTSGITEEFGEWSVKRTVNLYARPSLSLNVTDQNGITMETLTSFPFHLEAEAGPQTQAPIGYSVEIKARTDYETVDTIGNEVSVRSGDTIFSQYYDINTALNIDFSADNLDLENGQSYQIEVEVAMNSGLTAESTRIFDVNWEEKTYEPDCSIAIDESTYAAYLTPYCVDNDGNTVPNVTLGLYRREIDGQFTKIITGVEPGQNTVVTDPHPALDYARYRVVAIHKDTGAVSYYDIPSYPIGFIGVIIQWDEDWINLDTNNPDLALSPTWAGSMLKLQANVDINHSNKVDVAMINYAGRQYPVSYYGTSNDYTMTWSLDVPSEDKETLAALERLSRYAGDVYVRDYHGNGFWANVNLTINNKHNEVLVPIQFTITRVEGGM